MAKKTAKPTPVKPPKQSKGFLRGFFDVVKAIILSPVALIAALTRRLAGKEAVAEANAKYEAEKAEQETTRQNIDYANATTGAIQEIIARKDKNYCKEGDNIKTFEMSVPRVVPGDNQKYRFAMHVTCYDGTEQDFFIDGNGALRLGANATDKGAEQVQALLDEARPKVYSGRTEEQSPEPVDTKDDTTPEEPPSANEEVGKDEQNADMEELKTPTHEPRPDNPLFISYDVEKANGEKKSLLFEYCPVANDMGEHVGGYCQCFVGKPDPQSQVCKPDPQSQPEIWTLLSLDGNTLAGTSTVFGEDGYKFNAGETLKHITTGKYPLEGVILVPSGNCRALVINASDVPAPTVSILQEDEEGKFHLNALKNVKIEDLSKPTVIDALGLSEVSETEKNTPPTAEEARETENNTQHTEEESPEMDDPIGDDGPDL
jgi:hypothetical protein